jgi:hypothetical protein
MPALFFHRTYLLPVAVTIMYDIRIQTRNSTPVTS